MHILNGIHPDFMCYGVSAMENKLSTGVFKGRPFGGVAFLWRKSISNIFNIISHDSDGRCLCASLKCSDNCYVRIVNVYFPCCDASSDYRNTLDNCLGYIESVVCASDRIVLLGDMNFVCTDNSIGYRHCKESFNKLDLECCDDMCTSVDGFTYYNDSLGHGSFIDHFFLSSVLKPVCTSIQVIDSGANLSDHRPVVGTFQSSYFVQTHTAEPAQSDVVVTIPLPHAWRWDKADLTYYYDHTRSTLNTVRPPSVCLTCGFDCKCYKHYVLIERYYQDIVNALHTSACSTIPRIKVGSNKPYWNEELDRLKSDSIFWHGVWHSAGRPASGILHRLKQSTHLKYKLCIREAYQCFEDKLDDSITTHWLSKRPQEFWKAWHCKFSNKLSSKPSFPNCSSDTDVANSFAQHFGNCYSNSYNDVESAKEFYNDCMHSANDYDFCNSISVQLIDKCVRSLHLHKASGPDDLSAENLVNAHPSLIIHLKLLFSLIISHGYVPDAFGEGIIVPLVKDKSGKLNDVSNYRPITLTSVISKVFECILLNICQDSLTSDELQFGFKEGIGCSDAIFSIQTVVDYYVNNGSSVFASALDLKKAFDSVNHFKLLSTLLKSGIPLPIVNIIFCWYSKLFVRIRWNSSFSHVFSVGSGVRQGSIISPKLFNLFVNILITSLRSADIGCHIDGIYLGIFMYADDIILLSPSVKGLQAMINRCLSICKKLRLSINFSKSYCVMFGRIKKSVADPAQIEINNSIIPWVDSISYLGVQIVSGIKFSISVEKIRRNFYVAFNTIMSRVKHLEQLLQLSLIETYCMPLLTYGCNALTYSNKQINDLNVCLNNVYRTIFGFHRWESVKDFICGLGRLNFPYMHSLYRRKFFFHLLHCNCSILYDLLFVNLKISNAKDLNCIFDVKSHVIAAVYNDFSVLCT